MEVLYKIWAITILSTISGVLGRLGGRDKNGSWYDGISDSKTRDIGVSIAILLALWLLVGFNLTLWWLYLLCFGLGWGALSTYWDTIFKYDNFWFAGFASGLAIMPLLWGDVLLPIIISRAVLLAVVWGSLNKYLPKRVFIWRRDIAEEFLRYFFAVLTLLVFLLR